MALATQCPHCQTTFRVAHDQLKLRAGLVRCGACQEIFNGIEHLLRSEAVVGTPPEAARAPTLPPDEAALPSSESAISISPSALDVSATSTTEKILVEPEPDGEINADTISGNTIASSKDELFDHDLIDDASADKASADDIFAKDYLATAAFDAAVDPLARMTLMHVSDDANDPNSPLDSANESRNPDGRHGPELIAASSNGDDLLVHRSAHQSAHQSVDELDQAIDYLQRKPWRGTKKTFSREDVEGPSNVDHGDDTDEPNFVSRSRIKRHRRQTIRTALVGSIMLLMIGAVLQSTYMWRDQLAASVPATRSAMEWLCRQMGCRVGLPAQIDAVSIESNELASVTASKNNFALTLLLRNRSTLPQRWPAIELTLLDGSDKPLLRRVFEGREYLPAGVDAARGFAPNSEQTAKVTFELAQQKAANYRVYLFYP